jgi:hypothetical protein
MDPNRKTRRLIAVSIAAAVLGAGAFFAWRRSSVTGAADAPPAPPMPAAATPAAAAPPNGSSAGSPAASPGAKDPVVYDPTKLLDNDVPAAEVYDKEPRSEAWATAAELVVAGAMRRDLAAMVPEASIILKCRTLSCLVGIDAPEDKRAAALAVSKFLMIAPWVVDLEPEEDGTLRWLFFQEPRFGDPKIFVDWFEGARKRKLADIRSGKAPNPFPVPLDKIPTE